MVSSNHLKLSIASLLMDFINKKRIKPEDDAEEYIDRLSVDFGSFEELRKVKDKINWLGPWIYFNWHHRLP
jgi:hypothetical protein